MSILKTFFFSIMAFSFAAISNAQSADQIIGKNIAAIGGRDLISKIKSMSIDASLSAMGSDFPTKVSIVNGKAFKTVTSVNGSEVINCITDTGAWILNPFMGQTSPQSLPAEQAKMAKGSLFIGGPLLDYKAKGYSAIYVGRDTAKSKAYKIKLTDKNGAEIMFYIDPSTYYVLQMSVKSKVDGKVISNDTFFSNYKKTDYGFVVPYTTETSNSGYDITISYNKIDFNQDIDPQIFAMPKN